MTKGSVGLNALEAITLLTIGNVISGYWNSLKFSSQFFFESCLSPQPQMIFASNFLSKLTHVMGQNAMLVTFHLEKVWMKCAVRRHCWTSARGEFSHFTMSYMDQNNYKNQDIRSLVGGSPDRFWKAHLNLELCTPTRNSDIRTGPKFCNPKKITPPGFEPRFLRSVFFFDALTTRLRPPQPPLPIKK